MQDLGVELVSKQTPHNVVRRKMCGSLEEREGHSARGVLGITGFYLTGFPHKKSQLTMPPISFSLGPAPFLSAMQNRPGPTQENKGLAHTTRCPRRPPPPPAQDPPRPECLMKMLAVRGPELGEVRPPWVGGRTCWRQGQSFAFRSS